MEYGGWTVHEGGERDVECCKKCDLRRLCRDLKRYVRDMERFIRDSCTYNLAKIKRNIWWVPHGYDRNFKGGRGS